MSGLRHGMRYFGRHYATIASGKTLRDKGPLLTLEHVRGSTRPNMRNLLTRSPVRAKEESARAMA